MNTNKLKIIIIFLLLPIFLLDVHLVQIPQANRKMTLLNHLIGKYIRLMKAQMSM